MVRNNTSWSFEPKYLMDYRVLINVSTLLLVTPNGKECETNINDMKPSSTLELIENALNSFLNSIKNCQIMNRTWDHMTNYNTNMNSITTTSLPSHIKQLQQPLELKTMLLVHTWCHLPYTVTVSILYLQQWKALWTMTSSTSNTQQTLLRPAMSNVNSRKIESDDITTCYKFKKKFFF